MARQARADSLDGGDEVHIGLDARAHEAGSTLPCDTCYERPVLPDVAETAQRDATLQGALLITRSQLEG
jgi:hypothetical protein